MNKDEESKLRKLRKLGERLAEAGRSPWQPRAAVEAMLPEETPAGPWRLRPVTLRMWLCLDRARSPYVSGDRPKEAGVLIAALAHALSALSGMTVLEDDIVCSVPADAVVELDAVVRGHLSGAFATALRMERRREPGESSQPRAPGGFGWALTVFAGLRMAGFTRDEALDTPLIEAFALGAVRNYQEHRMEPVEATYAQRDAEEKMEAGEGNG